MPTAAPPLNARLARQIDTFRERLDAARARKPEIDWYAYDIFGKGRTVFRAGFAAFYPSIFNSNFFGNPAGFSTTQTDYTSSVSNTRASATRWTARPRRNSSSKLVSSWAAAVGSTIARKARSRSS